MNYHNITSPDMLNGEGLRTVLWVSGCSHNCKGCHNPETHPLSSGIPFDYSAFEELMNKCKPDYISGITFSGGDPLHPRNYPEIRKIARTFKEHFPKKNIWIYTGFTFEYLKEKSESDETLRALLSLTDVIIDGKFEIDKKDPLLHFRGSSNQRIIDVQKSLSSGKVVEREY